ncbi:hypothetical protein H012_gp779 [Acanthamoeba polyphaga moumouvirus]|uniref:Uncharacterized protein n=1 Tax=Acanthamoeba polyphaga moumouvirus TaxID=1269028 RepID=L7RBY8_9VIRU|nr:hypothetical protein H012_gp779 [Acanthamoeba polyphaga moumouvirus]AGC01686.1 hypothetical protein Moumou_00142 [Acanthamoeba polyphaga moumouvirus]AQN68024.1 hypothetical protein [Saudi moumouvirus]
MESYLTIETICTYNKKCKRNCVKKMVRYVPHYDHKGNIKDGKNKSEAPNATFLVHTNNIRVNITYTQKDVTSEMWTKFINAMKECDSETIYFPTNKGNMRICTEFGTIIFSLESCSMNNTGEIYIEVTNDECLDAFIEALKEIQHYEKNYKFYLAKI